MQTPTIYKSEILMRLWNNKTEVLNQCYSYDFHLGRIWFRGDISFEGDISPVPGYFEGDIGYGGPSALRF